MARYGMTVPRRVCPCCLGDHAIEFCTDGAEHRRVPLEVKSHNGPYQGSVPIRVLPQGVSGSREFKKMEWGGKPEIGHAVQSRNALMRRMESQDRGASHNRRKTHCSKGHEFSEANTYLDPSGKRKCRACIKARVR